MINSNEKVLFLKRLVENYPIISIEDGMSEDDEKFWYVEVQNLTNDLI